MGSIIEAHTNDAPERGHTDAQHGAASAVSWGAILAGATAATALLVILLLLGTGLGFGALSPWGHEARHGAALGPAMIGWLLFTQVVAYGLGGYLAGRLRTKWIATQRDEVYFRDTAHGFLAWAVASLLCAALLSSVLASPSHPRSHDRGWHGAAGADATSPRPSSRHTLTYFVDALLRAPPAGDGVADARGASPSRALRAEVEGIFSHDLAQDTLAPEDLAYLARRIAHHSGLSTDAAAQRVEASYAALITRLRDQHAAAQAHAEQSQRTASHGALWLFLALLVGAFVASLAATFGGAQRDA